MIADRRLTRCIWKPGTAAPNATQPASPVAGLNLSGATDGKVPESLR